MDFDDIFHDVASVKPGTWHPKGIFIPLADGGEIQVGVYREPIDEGQEYSGTLTLQIFCRDDVVGCYTIKE